MLSVGLFHLFHSLSCTPGPDVIPCLPGASPLQPLQSIACHWSDCKPCNSRSAFFWPRHGASADFEMYTYPVQRKQIKDNQRLPGEMDADHAEGRWTANLRITLQSWHHLAPFRCLACGRHLTEECSNPQAQGRFLERKTLCRI